MIESNQLYSRAIDAVGAKKVAHALDLSLSHTYRIARNPMDIDNPDGTGARNDLDRLEAFGDLMAAHPAFGLSVLVLLRMWIDERFARWFGTAISSPLVDSELAAKAGEVCKEFGELLQQLRPGFDADVVAKEASDVVAVLEQLIKAAECTDDKPATKTLRVGA